LHKYNDISEYILRDADNLSENDMEDVIEGPEGKKPGTNKMSIKLYVIYE
jgi:hypothetical protein